MVKSLDIDIVWGGFYATTTPDDDEFSVFRLLDFNRDSYHIALYDEQFDSVPKFDDISATGPYIAHTPIDVKALLNKKEILLIHAKPLVSEDLEGYMSYLEAHGVPQEKLDEIVQRLIGFSNGPPLRLHLEMVDEELVITQRE